MGRFGTAQARDITLETPRNNWEDVLGVAEVLALYTGGAKSRCHWELILMAPHVPAKTGLGGEGTVSQKISQLGLRLSCKLAPLCTHCSFLLSISFTFRHFFRYTPFTWHYGALCIFSSSQTKCMRKKTKTFNILKKRLHFLDFITGPISLCFSLL